MKGLFTGDFHYGLRVEELDRTKEVDLAVHFIVDHAIKNELDFFSIGGDLTDNNNPHPDYIAMLIKVLNRLEDAEIPTFIMRGNHCAVSAEGRVWALTPLEQVDYNNIHFITHPKLIKYGDIIFLFLPHVTRSDAIAAGYKTAQEYINGEAEKLVEEAEGPVTIIAHYNVNGCQAGTEALMLRQSDLQLPGVCTRSPKVVKVVNSHIHTAQDKGKIIMPGSPICTDFGDLENPKGFITGEYQNGEKPSWNFETIATPQSPMQEFELDFRGMKQKDFAKELQDMFELVENDSIVKVRVLIEEENLSFVNSEGIKEGLLTYGANYVKQIDKVVMRKKSVRDKTQLPTLAPIDAVKNYFDKRKPEGMDRKLELALRIIEGQKLEKKESIAPFLNETAAMDSLDVNLDELDIDISYPDEFDVGIN